MITRNQSLFGLAAGVVFICGSILAVEPSARACSLAAPTPYPVDPAAHAVDTESPSGVKVSNIVVKRGRGSGQGCGGGNAEASSCDDLGWVTFAVTADDDQTLPDEMGYAISVARGKAPFAASQIERPIRPQSDGSLMLWWLDGATDMQEDLDFVLEVRAVDMAGNASLGGASVPVFDGNTACRIGGGRGSSRGVLVAGAALVALIVAGRRRPRRRARP